MIDYQSEHIRSNWFIACQSHKLKNTPLALTLFDEKIVLFRSTEGESNAIINQCPHRNMALDRGRVTSKGLKCCYHGWTFDGKGQATDIPSSKTCHTGAIKSYPLIEKNSVIWIYMGKEPPNTSPPLFPNIHNKKSVTWIMQRHFQGSAFQCVENFLDVPHTAFVHKKWFRDSRRENILFNVYSEKNWVEAEFLNESPIDTILGKCLFPKGAQIKHTDRFTLPFNTRVDYQFGKGNHILIMSFCTPISENQTMVYTYMAVILKRFQHFPYLMKTILKPITQIILNQDVDIIQKQQTDLERNISTQFRFHETDTLAKEIWMLLQNKPLSHLPKQGEFLV